MVKKNACVFISGYGSNLKSLIDNSRNHNFPVNISLVITNNFKAKGLLHAKKNSIPYFIINTKRRNFENKVLNLCQKNLIHSAANITGGGIVENIIRSIPENLTANIDLSKIRVLKIFSWLKSKNISDKEMLRTFNCGVGFCLITKKSNYEKIKKYFSESFSPYIIGYISKDNKRLSLSNKIKW